MPEQPRGRVRQDATAGRNANVAARDQIIADQVVIAGTGATEPVVPGLLPRDVLGFAGRDDELAWLAGLAGGGRVVVSAIGGSARPRWPSTPPTGCCRSSGRHLYADLRGYTEGQDPAEPGEVLQVFLCRLGVPAEECLMPGLRSASR